METIIYGGTFDPPTNAHSEIIQACLGLKNAGEVWVMPSAKRDDKPNVTDPSHRLNMINLMIANDFSIGENVSVCSAEIFDLPTPTHTIATVDFLHSKYPEKTFRFVFGADSYATMHTWKRGLHLQKTLSLAVIERPGYKTPHVKNVQRIWIPSIMSSTLVRSRYAAGKTTDDLVCSPVDRYVRENKLYVVQ